VNPEDKDRPINEETRSRYGVTAYPAVLFVSPDGGLIQRASGFLTPDQFSPIMKDALKKEAEFQETLEKLKAKSDDAKLNIQAALTYLERKQLEEAVSFSEKAFEHDPKNRTKLIPNLHNQLGLAYGALVEGAMLENNEEAETHFEKAVSHFKTVIDTYPKSKAYEPAQYYLGVTHAIKGNYEDAIATLEKLSNHAKDKNIRQNAEAMLERVKDLASSN
jgi:tetratricopeptide (TPR) repeat protein